jgi:DNA-binding LacI/PurR family transcriptional regulator
LVKGFKQGLARYDRTLQPEFIYAAEHLGEKSGYQVAEEMLKGGNPLPRALFVVDDILAYGVIKGFTDAGRRVPQDVAIIGFGDIDSHGTFLTDLTTVRQPARQKGYQAAELLHTLIEHPDERKKPHAIILEPTLTIRRSCGCN